MDDLISRQAAIDAIAEEFYYNDEDYRTAVEAIGGLPSAQPDLIRRSEVIEAIDNIDWYRKDSNKDMVSGAKDVHEAWYKAEDVYKALESVPSAQPEKRWIPCSERLPDERQDVYVTVLWDDYGDYITAYGMRTRFGWHLHSNAEGELIKGYTVIAWIPLPEPYRTEGDDNHEG